MAKPKCITFVLLDRNGRLLRDTLLVRFQSRESVAGVALTPAGDYVIAGGTDRGQNGYPDQLIFALRKWDRLLPTPARQPAAPARLSAYPNPTADELTLEAANGQPLTGTWTLYDLLGRPVQRGSLPGRPAYQLSLAQHPVGLYLLRMTDEQGHAVQTLRLEKK